MADDMEEVSLSYELDTEALLKEAIRWTRPATAISLMSPGAVTAARRRLSRSTR